jgi:hypothetical protein
MPDLKPDDDPAKQDLNTQELLEWRDLQNAQIESMKHVWDNPDDERWNDIPIERPTTPAPGAGEYSEAYPYLTDAQLDLFDRMSEISEETLCASWVADNEFNIWNAITLGSPAPGYGAINPRLLRRCQKLANEIGGWIRWTDGPQFVPMAQWLELVEARRKADVTQTL